jgi:hypothetical protein
MPNVLHLCPVEGMVSSSRMGDLGFYRENWNIQFSLQNNTLGYRYCPPISVG